MNFKRPKIWACSRLLATSFLGLFCAGGFLNLNMTMMVAHAEGHVFDGNCINRTTYDPQTGILTIPPGYTEIKGLGNRKGIKIVKIPASITEIGGAAFRDCSSLTNVNIAPNSELKTIGFDAFHGCTALETINLPEGLQKIGKHAFYNCTSLTSISIPSNVNTIGENAFGFCTSLREIFLPRQIEVIDTGTFAGCSSLENINIPDGVKWIGGAAFLDCTSLKTIGLPKELRKIGRIAFENCISITDINMPDTVLEIEDSVFCGCTSLKKVHLSENLQKIPYCTFQGCSSLENISVPNKVQEIENAAFGDCASLKELSFPPSLEIFNCHAFGNHCNSLKLIKIPDHTKITGPYGEEIDAPIIVRGMEIERYACDFSPNVSEGEKPSPGSFRGGFLGSMGLVQMRMMADVTTNRILRNRENMPLPSSPIPDSDNPFFEKTSKFKNPAVAELEETVREEQPCRSTGKLSLMTMGWGLVAGAALVAGHNMILDPNILYNHGSEATDPYAFLDGYHFVLRYGIYCLEKIDKGEFN